MKKASSILVLTAMYDLASETFGAPVSTQTEAVARRQFMMSMAKVMPGVRQDYQLFQLGTYDSMTGKVFPCKKRIDVTLPDFENDPMFQMPDNVVQFKKDEVKKDEVK